MPAPETPAWFPPETRPPVTLEQIARYCYAVDDLSPLYLDQEAAARGPHGGIVAPPLFFSAPGFKPVPLSQLREDGLPNSEAGPSHTNALGMQSRLMGEEIELFAFVRPGDALTKRTRFAGSFEKHGRSGTLHFSVRETEVTNQRGELVCIQRVTTAAVPQRPANAPSTVGAQRAALPRQAKPQPQLPFSTEPRRWEQIKEGDPLPELMRVVTPVQAFLYGAVKGNSHRIHYDRDYAAQEGLPERVAQGDLLGDLLCQLAVRWMGPAGILKRFSYEVRGPGFLNECIIHRGRIVRKWREAETGLVELDLSSEGAGGRLCLRGTATVALA